MSGLQDKIVLITGASAEIGASAAVEFAKRGAKVFLTGRDDEKLKQVAQQCQDVGRSNTEVGYVAADLLHNDAADKIARAVLERFSTLHILVNNARMISQPTLPFSKHKTIEAFDEQYHISVRSPMLLIGRLLDEICKNKGSIINISSTLSTVARPRGIAYCSMKSAQNQMTRCLAVELGIKGVRVNTVSPGVTLPSMNWGFGRDEVVAQSVKLARRAQPLEQKLILPQDVANTIVFLASDDASHITGINVPVDCGFLLAHPIYNFSKL